MKTPEDFNTDPLDALLADVLQKGSASLPDDGFTARVSTEIRLRDRRQRWLRIVPWALGLLVTALTFIFRPQSVKIPQFSGDLPNSATFRIPTWMEKAHALARLS